MTLFITFEGPEGSGKTTQIQLLDAALRKRGLSVINTREPGGTQIGNAIRSLLLNQAHVEIVPNAEALLFNAARAQLVGEVIRPALQRGDIVLCDRYADSTLAYQGYGNKQPLDRLKYLIDFATEGLIPSLTIYLDIDPQIGLSRKQDGDKEEWNRMEAKALAYHQTVRQGYLHLAKEEPTRWMVMDATQKIEIVHQMIIARVLQMADEKKQ